MPDYDDRNIAKGDISVFLWNLKVFERKGLFLKNEVRSPKIEDGRPRTKVDGLVRGKLDKPALELGHNAGLGEGHTTHDKK